MKIILCGYHWTGCKALEIIRSHGHEVYVYTHETENSVADLEGLCLREGVNYTLDKISIDNIPFAPDLICSIYYRYLIDEKVIKLVDGRIFNLHPALLPRYRGCSSLTWAMINGDDVCGYTYHYIEQGCDTGDIILQKTIRIEKFDTQLTLYNKVMFESMNDFEYVLDYVLAKKSGRKQEGVPTYYKRGCPMNGEISEKMAFDEKERFVRAMIYPPYPPAKYQGKEIKSYRELLSVSEKREQK